MDIQFNAVDGVLLNGVVIEAEQPKAVVLLNPGTATKTHFYRPFAEYLADNGYHVMLWNYRGFCISRTQELAHSDIEYTHIGERDIPAAITKAKALYPDLPLYCIGHSTGGQQIGLAANCNELDGLISVAVSTGYYSDMPAGYRRQAKLFFKVITPISIALFGYVKAKKLNLMEDLPPKLAKEWGQWCAKPDFMFDKKFKQQKPQIAEYRTFEFPVHVLTADDDEISTAANTERFWRHIKSTKPIEFTYYKAAEMPNKAVGHFGYFRRANQQVWVDILRHLDGFNG